MGKIIVHIEIVKGDGLNGLMDRLGVALQMHGMSPRAGKYIITLEKYQGRSVGPSPPGGVGEVSPLMKERMKKDGNAKNRH